MIFGAALLLVFVLQAVVPAAQAVLPDADTRFVDWFVRLLPIGLSLYALLSGRSREDRKAHDKALADLVLAKENHSNRIQGMQVEFERAMDDMLKRHKAHEEKLSEVGRIREEMAGMRAELKYVAEGFKEISHKLDRALEQRNK